MVYDVVLSPLSAALALFAGTLITLLPRRMAMMPILAGLCFLPSGQSLEIAGLHFYLFRLILLVSFTRVLIRGEIRSIRWCQLDTLVVLWITAFVGFGSLNTAGASFITLGGIAFDWLTSYIVTRSLLRDRDDVYLQIHFLAIMIIPLAATMIVEKEMGSNVFAVLGGVNEISVIREGQVRAQGPFQHPILTGTFGATLLPLMIGLIRMRNGRLIWSGVAGSFCAALIVWAAASSGPLLAAWSCMAAFCFWGLRQSLFLVRIGLLLIVLMLQAGMDRPAWWIFDTVGLLSGGTGWHRSYIIDAAIRHWDEWWLIGTSRTVHWGGFPPAVGNPDNIDITNEYILQAVTGGALTLCLFLAILWTCFNQVGSAFHAKRRAIDPETEWLTWCTGVALLALISFFSMTYFDQKTFFILCFFLTILLMCLKQVRFAFHAGRRSIDPEGEWLSWCMGVALLTHCISFFSMAYFDRNIFYFFWLLSAIAAGTTERTWLICDQSVQSVRRATSQQSSGLSSEGGGRGAKLPGVRRTRCVGEPLL
jgi:hypothetical protein